MSSETTFPNATAIRDSRWEERSQLSSVPCFVCGRFVRINKNTRFVRWVDDNLLRPDLDPTSPCDDMGWFAVGPDCRRKGLIPDMFLTATTRPL